MDFGTIFEDFGWILEPFWSHFGWIWGIFGAFRDHHGRSLSYLSISGTIWAGHLAGDAEIMHSGPVSH